MFAASIVCRFVAVVAVARIQEPHVYETIQVVTQLIGVTPIRVLRYPVGLYRNLAARRSAAASVEPVRMRRSVAARTVTRADMAADAAPHVGLDQQSGSLSGIQGAKPEPVGKV
jgi:hypothetical protein